MRPGPRPDSEQTQTGAGKMRAKLPYFGVRGPEV